MPGGSDPSIPPVGNVPPATINTGPAVPQQPQTYRIPVYGDGKLVREDVVLKPND
jgi:hypothetical protein